MLIVGKNAKSMHIRWIRLVVGALAAEIAGILVLVSLVAVFGPHEGKAAEAYAEKLGRWVGPLTGIAFGFLGAFLIARPLEKYQLLHGALFGCFQALVDAALLVATQTPFEWLFVVSNLGRIGAAVGGGLWAGRSVISKRTTWK